MVRKTRGKTDPKIVVAARDQRRQPTEAEDILWEALRDRRLNGVKFRRQHPFGRYVLDFFCVKHQLAIEIDGEIHRKKNQIEHDIERTAFLEEIGVQLIRFRNEEVKNLLGQVIKRILEIVEPHPLSPSPDEKTSSGEGERG